MPCFNSFLLISFSVGIYAPTPLLGCGRDEIHLNGTEGNFSNLDHPSDYQKQALNCTWILSVPADHQVELKFYIFQLYDCLNEYIEVREGHTNRHLGSFCGSQSWKLWSVFSSGNNMLVKYISPRTSNSYFQASFEAIRSNQTTCRGGWMRFGYTCLGTATLNRTIGNFGAKKICGDLNAKPLQVKFPNCAQLYSVRDNSIMVTLKINQFTLRRKEPLLGGCTFPVTVTNKEKVVYSVCNNMVYLLCYKDDEGDVLTPAVVIQEAKCSSVFYAWNLPPLNNFCLDTISFVLQINSSQGRLVGTWPLDIHYHSFGWNLPNNRRYTIRFYAVRKSNNSLVGSTWQTEVTLNASAVPDSPKIEVSKHLSNETFVTILWSNPHDYGCYILMFTIYYKTYLDPSIVTRWRSTNITYGSNTPAFTNRMYKLQLNAQVGLLLELMVTAWNSEGESRKDLANVTVLRLVKFQLQGLPTLVLVPASASISSVNLTETIAVPKSSKSNPKVALIVSMTVLALLTLVAAIGICAWFIRRRRNSSTKRRGKRKLRDHWELRREDLKLIERIGQGEFGEVHTAEMKASDFLANGEKRLPRKRKKEDKQTSIVAVKILREDAECDQRKEFLKEIELMKVVGCHRNIVNMLRCCTSDEPMFLVVEYLPNGDLLNYLRKRKIKIEKPQLRESTSAEEVNIQVEKSHANSYYNESSDVADSDLDEELLATDLLSFSWQIAKGMEYLSSKGIVHRDLAARNVLVGDNKAVKVADFGLSRQVSEEKIYHCGKPKKLPIKWMAPEALYEKIFTTKSDVWAYGVLLWEIATLGGSPYPGITNAELYKHLKHGYRMKQPTACSSEMYEIMVSCWKVDPTNRPTFTQLYEAFEVMLQRNTPYLDLTQMRERPENEYTVLSSSGGDKSDSSE